jgi:hypothetical protein
MRFTGATRGAASAADDARPVRSGVQGVSLLKAVTHCFGAGEGSIHTQNN